MPLPVHIFAGITFEGTLRT